MSVAPAVITPKKWQQHAIPGLDTSDSDVQAYMDRSLNPLSSRRRWHMMDAAERARFFHGDQWIRKSMALAAGMGAYNFVNVSRRSRASFKHPVTNIVRGAVLNELARLSKKEYIPEASASKTEARWIAAANAARDILMAEAQQLLWTDKREQVVFNDILDGTAIVKTYRDESLTKLAPIAALNAVRCDHCDLTLASNQIPVSMLESGFPHPDGQQMVPLQPNAVTMPDPGEIPPGMKAYTGRLNVCPLCGNNLQPYKVSPEEAQDGTDFLGNPLGQMLPEGENCLDVVSMHDFYPQNAGVRIEPHECRSWGQITVRELEWIVERLPMLEDDLEPEDSIKLLRLDPLYSSQVFSQQSTYWKFGGMDVYTHHARVKELHVAPRNLPGYEQGASFIQVGDIPKIIRMPLCVEDKQGNLVPRVKYHFARRVRVPGQFWGTTFVHDLLPINRRLNEIDAQTIDLRERGKPMIWTKEGVEATVRDDQEGAFLFIEYNNDADPNFSPSSSVTPAVPMSGQAYHQERDDCFSDAQRCGAAQDIEMGQSVGGVKTTSGLMLISEEATQIRGPVERGLVGLYESVWQHILDLKKTFESGGTYERMNEEIGVFETAEWQTEDLVGTSKVKVTVRAGYDNVLYQKESTAEAIQSGLIDISSPVAKAKCLENMKMPQINEPIGIQIRRAEMAWAEFERDLKVPILDETLFNVPIWFELFGKHWLEDFCLQLQNQVDFDGFFARLIGWQDEFVKMDAQDQQQRAIYGNMDPAQWQGTYSQIRIAYERARAAMGQAGLPQEQLPQPPPPPPLDGQFLPRPMQLRIEAVWKRMLGPGIGDAVLGVYATEQAGVGSGPAGAKLKLTLSLLRMRACIEALGMLARRQQVSPLPAPPTPGAGQAQPGAPAPQQA